MTVIEGPKRVSALNHVVQKRSNKPVAESFQKKHMLQINWPETIHLFNLSFGFRGEPINLKMLFICAGCSDDSSLRMLSSWN